MNETKSLVSCEMLEVMAIFGIVKNPVRSCGFSVRPENLSGALSDLADLGFINSYR